MKPKNNVKDFFLNLGATIALYTTVGSLISLLFSVINTAYPRITTGYGYSTSSSISWPVAILVIFFPIFILLQWLIGKDYTADPERKNAGIHKWLTYLTLFVAGLLIAGDLIMVLYYFIDGQELTTGFLLKILSLIIIAGGVFAYYITDIRGKLNPTSRMAWRIVALVIVLASIVWGFSVLGSPRTQRLYKYDDQKINDLMNINGAVQSYYGANGNKLPKNFTELSVLNYYINTTDAQSGKAYEYNVKSNTSYELCAEFNKASNEGQITMETLPYGGTSWTHPVGRYCFLETINPNAYPVPKGF